MLRLNLKGARARVRTRFRGAGSVRAETIETGCEGVEVRLELESDEPAEQVAKLARVAEAGCVVMQTVRSSTTVSSEVMLNGAPLALSP